MMMVASTLVALGTTDRMLYLYDTYAGHPRPDPDLDRDLYDHPAVADWERETEHGSRLWADVSIDIVRSNIASTSYPMDRVVFVEGKVENTLLGTRPDQIALLRLDVDWYAPTIACMVHLYPRLCDHGVLIIDDYGHYKGCRQAVDEYLESATAPMLLNRIDYTCRTGVKNINRSIRPMTKPLIFPGLLSHRLDVDTAVEKLMRRPSYARNPVDVAECLRMIGELRTLVVQQEGALAERDAAVARILELQDQLERFERGHADAMAETSRIQAAEQDAAVARILELQDQLERFERAHADAMAEASRIRAAEQDVALARIFELQDRLERFERAHADAMAEASRIRAAEQDAALARIFELQDQLERFERAHADAMAEASRIQAAEQEAATARIMELERQVARLISGKGAATCGIMAQTPQAS
jgi:phage host-nuclease inhibitor protein Gam